MTGRPAAFVDRDGTIIRDASYIRNPADVEVLPGVAAALRELNNRGVAVIVVTNQSGIGRGMLTTRDYEAVTRRLDALLAADRWGARIDATYMCPHHPDVTGPCECRKPGLALYRRAIHDHQIDPARSAYIGDRWRDVAPALVLGGMPILLDVDSTLEEDRVDALRNGVATAPSFAQAIERYVATLPAPRRGE